MERADGAELDLGRPSSDTPREHLHSAACGKQAPVTRTTRGDKGSAEAGPAMRVPGSGPHEKTTDPTEQFARLREASCAATSNRYQNWKLGRQHSGCRQKRGTFRHMQKSSDEGARIADRCWPTHMERPRLRLRRRTSWRVSRAHDPRPPFLATPTPRQPSFAKARVG